MKKLLPAFIILAIPMTLSALPATAASVSKTYSYFAIGGSTLDEIEDELGKFGPQIKNGGRRHPGATRMEFTTRLGYAEEAGFCRIAEARVSVKANVILPRWGKRKGSDGDTRVIWDTLSADIRRHEESHIVIARNHAHELESALKAMRRRPNCPELAEAARKTTADVLARHDAAQARFDRVEGINFESRMLRLLRYRLERLQDGRLSGG